MVDVSERPDEDIALITFEMPLKLYKALEWYCMIDKNADIESMIVGSVRTELIGQRDSGWPVLTEYLNKEINRLLEV